MTTIAWDGRTLAGDTQATSSGMVRRLPAKVFRIEKGAGHVLFGACGLDQDMHLVVQWIAGGMLPIDRPKLDEDSFAGIYIDSTGACRLESKLIRLPMIDRFHAIGSGRDFAMAAMHLGKSAREAVEVASEFDIYTSGPIIEVSL